ncbi:MAG: HAD-IIIA family hydrolase [Planctomycetes bacterium]|nr:HAD-IIIA family hydrolase [Planctomycetota bacterium]
MHLNFAPLPGTQQPRRGLFIDHTGTLLETPECGFIASPDELTFTPGALESLFHAGQSGWNIYLIGNERGVQDGHISQETWEEVHSAMIETMRTHGITVTRSYICIDHPDESDPGRRDSVYRLPNTGAMYHAAQTEGISLPRSWVVGDHTEDLVAGWRAGCHMAGVRTGWALGDGTLHVEPEIFSDNLGAAVRELTSGMSLSR